MEKIRLEKKSDWHLGPGALPLSVVTVADEKKVTMFPDFYDYNSRFSRTGEIMASFSDVCNGLSNTNSTIKDMVKDKLTKGLITHDFFNFEYARYGSIWGDVVIHPWRNTISAKGKPGDTVAHNIIVPVYQQTTLEKVLNSDEGLNLFKVLSGERPDTNKQTVEDKIKVLSNLFNYEGTPNPRIIITTPSPDQRIANPTYTLLIQLEGKYDLHIQITDIKNARGHSLDYRQETYK